MMQKHVPVGMELRLKKSSNYGLVNPPLTNMCWFNSVVQLLEMTDLPLFLEGIANLEHMWML